MQVQDLSFLVESLGNNAFSQRFKKLSRSLCEVNASTAKQQAIFDGKNIGCMMSMRMNDLREKLQAVVQPAARK